MAATTSTTTMPPRVGVVCFSMDRVFQLSEYLRTLHLHLLFEGRRLRDDHAWAAITVIARCSTPAIRAFYDEIAGRYAHVRFVFEDPGAPTSTGDFAACLLEALGLPDGDSPTTTAPPPPFDLVLFNVDDAFYFDDVDLAKAAAFLTPTPPPPPPPTDNDATPTVAAPDRSVWPFAFHIKLAPSIWRSHLTNQPMLPLPPMATVLPPQVTDPAVVAMSPELLDTTYLSFDPARGCLDWSYPWELSGSVYHHDTVARVLAAIVKQHGREGISRPNHLELRGHEIVHGQWMNRTHRLRCACLPRPKMHVFAINQVQDLFENRLYATDHTASPDEGSELLATSTGDLTHLLRLYESKETLDESYYRRHRFSSVHIGSLVLASATTAQPRARGSVDWTADHNPLVSVVIPVYNLEDYVAQALESILRQTYTQMEIIVIDDASSDSSAEIIQDVMKRDTRVKYARNDENLGIAASLNKGFSMAQGTFVARMDADDIAFPDRIQRQIHFMLEHPHVDILGTSVLVGRDCAGPSDTEYEAGYAVETAVYPTSPLATKWQLLFGCFIAHPTVMMNRRVLNTIVASNGQLYSTTTPKCEDYDLWLRCAYQHELTIMSLGDVLLFHRKHKSNTSSVHRQEQVAQTLTTAATWFRCLLEDDSLTTGGIVPLLDHESTSTCDELCQAISLLGRLQAKISEGTKRDAARLTSGLGSIQDQDLVKDEWEAEKRYVGVDAASRQGELAFRAMMMDPVIGGAAWSEYSIKFPQISRAAFAKLLARDRQLNSST